MIIQEIEDRVAHRNDEKQTVAAVIDAAVDQVENEHSIGKSVMHQFYSKKGGKKRKTNRRKSRKVRKTRKQRKTRK